MKGKLHYATGDATAPAAAGHKIIAHVCNDSGRWGKGFVLALNKRWKAPEQHFRAAFAADKPALGEVQFIQVEDDITVANIIGQHGIRPARNTTAPAPIRYEAVRAGLLAVARHAQSRRASVHMPRIGCGLAGGRWVLIEPIIDETLIAAGIQTWIYDL